uniref:Rhomboid domain-containing protein n=1 Tax=Gongylonema pulchrum TaxID=637853 RepID=A0A183EF76_9BILA
LYLSKFIFQNPSSLVCGVVLLYYSRWVERRFGSSKFMSFILLNLFQTVVIEMCVFFVISRIYSYIPSSVYFAIGPYALLTALYLAFLTEMPLVPHTSLLGLPLSIHILPFIMFIQLFELSKRIPISCAAGALSFVLQRTFFSKTNLIPSFLTNIFCSTANPIGWFAQKFAEFGEIDWEYLNIIDCM